MGLTRRRARNVGSISSGYVLVRVLGGYAFQSRLPSGQLARWLQKGGIEHLGCHDLATADKPDLVRPVIGDGAMYRA